MAILIHEKPCHSLWCSKLFLKKTITHFDPQCQFQPLATIKILHVCMPSLGLLTTLFVFLTPILDTTVFYHLRFSYEIQTYFD